MYLETVLMDSNSLETVELSTPSVGENLDTPDTPDVPDMPINIGYTGGVEMEGGLTGSASESESASESGSESGSETGSESVTAVPAVDYNSPDIHEDIECMLTGNNREIIELVSTDPEYYLDLVQHYHKTRNGTDIYLSDLFNIIIERVRGHLHVKFKLSDNTQWYEVGYGGGSFCDEDVYKAFTEKVQTVLRAPQKRQREVLQETMEPPAQKAAPMVSQGNQEKLTKIDRFLERTGLGATVEESSTVGAEIRDIKADIPACCVDNIPYTEKYIPVASNDPGISSEVSQAIGRVAAPPASVDVLPAVVQSYKNMLKEKLAAVSSEQTHQASRTSVGGLGASSRQYCPAELLDEFNQICGVVNNDTSFVKHVVQEMGGARAFVGDFLGRCLVRQQPTHSDLCKVLDLSNDDVEILRAYSIDLTRL